MTRLLAADSNSAAPWKRSEKRGQPQGDHHHHFHSVSCNHLTSCMVKSTAKKKRLFGAHFLLLLLCHDLFENCKDDDEHVMDTISFADEDGK